MYLTIYRMDLIATHAIVTAMIYLIENYVTAQRRRVSYELRSEIDFFKIKAEIPVRFLEK